MSNNVAVKTNVLNIREFYIKKSNSLEGSNMFENCIHLTQGLIHDQENSKKNILEKGRKNTKSTNQQRLTNIPE